MVFRREDWLGILPSLIRLHLLVNDSHEALRCSLSDTFRVFVQHSDGRGHQRSPGELVICEHGYVLGNPQFKVAERLQRALENRVVSSDQDVWTKGIGDQILLYSLCGGHRVVRGLDDVQICAKDFCYVP